MFRIVRSSNHEAVLTGRGLNDGQSDHDPGTDPNPCLCPYSYCDCDCDGDCDPDPNPDIFRVLLVAAVRTFRPVLAPFVRRVFVPLREGVRAQHVSLPRVPSVLPAPLHPFVAEFHAFYAVPQPLPALPLPQSPFVCARPPRGPSHAHSVSL